MKKSLLPLLLALLLFAACQPAAAPRSFTTGEPLHTYDFTGTGSFEEGIYDGASLSIINGIYQIDVRQGDNVLWWGQWGDNYDNVVIDVDAEQQSEALENAYGVMCRVSGSVGQRVAVDPTLAAIMQDSTTEATAETTTEATSEVTTEATPDSAATDESAATEEAGFAVDIPLTAEATAETTPEATGAAALTATPMPTQAAISQGDGYAFLIQGSGSYAIMRARSRQLTPLVNWTESDAIQQGPARNHIRAVCVGSYLALYINDRFVASATDDTYTSGQVGLAASAANRLGTRIAFDNLAIAAAS